MALKINKIYQGDCLELLKYLDDNSVDLVLTAPPYFVSKDCDDDASDRPKIFFGKQNENYDPLSWIDEIPRVLTKDASVIIFYSLRDLWKIEMHCEKNGMIIKNELMWRYRIKLGNFSRILNGATWCVANEKSRWTYNNTKNTIYEIEDAENIPLAKVRDLTGHATQKSSALMKKIIKIHSHKGNTVLDPFAGSGTTAIACLKSDRDFICIENKQEYFNEAKVKIAEEKDKRGNTDSSISKWQQRVHDYIKTNAGCTKGQLQRMLHLKAGELENFTESLLNSGKIIEKSKGNFGRPSVLYYPKN